jgi:hypothetical protein
LAQIVLSFHNKGPSIRAKNVDPCVHGEIWGRNGSSKKGYPMPKPLARVLHSFDIDKTLITIGLSTIGASVAIGGSSAIAATLGITTGILAMVRTKIMRR